MLVHPQTSIPLHLPSSNTPVLVQFAWPRILKGEERIDSLNIISANISNNLIIQDFICVKPFIGEKCGLFQQERTCTPRNSSEPLPKIVGIDPGQKNVWLACLYNSDVLFSANDQDGAIPIFNLKRSEYNRSIGLFWLRTWPKQKSKEKKY